MKVSSVKIKDNIKALRFDASFHLSEGLQVKRLIKDSPYRMLHISDVTERIFYGNRAKRVYVTSRKYGEPFLSSSDILQADLENVKLASKKYTPNIEQLRLERGWTLISRSGTIGNCAFSSQLHAQKLASEHVIRLVPNYILREGVVYAYLASKYGHSLLTQGTFGAVIQHIEPDFVGSIPIPDFPEDFQKEVDDLIQESAKLREEAAKNLNEAHLCVEALVGSSMKNTSNCVSVKSVLSSHNTRFEGNYYVSDNRRLYDYITSTYKCRTLGDCTDKIFRPGIFKREYVKDGVMFLGGADIMMAIPHSEKYLSYRQVNKMPELRVQKDWMLVTCGGTIGNMVYIDEQIAKCAISQHVMRIVPKKDVPSGFLYGFLSSTVGHKLINLFTYGSVIPSVEPHHLDLVPIPIISDEKVQKIDSLVKQYVVNIELAKEKETRAISMVEQEIEKWNKQ